MRCIKGISYDSEKDADVMEFLGAKDNFSKYILRLVRQDMFMCYKAEVVIEYLYSKVLAEQSSS